MAVFLSSFQTWATSTDVKYKIQHRKTKLEMSWDGKLLKARDRLLDISIPAKKCNEKLLEDFFAIDRKIWKNTPAEKPDTIVVEKNGETHLVASQSQLGGHLLSFSNKLRYLMNESNRLCK